MTEFAVDHRAASTRRRTRGARTRVIALLIVTALAGTVVVACRPVAQTPPGTQVINDPGFGSAANSYSWSMAWFKGHLYVGTARSQYCVENATLDFYNPGAYYPPTYIPEVTCPADPNDLDLRAEIWRYTPETGAWERVYVSPVVPNPRAPGKSVARDIGYRGMTVHVEADGTEALYVAGTSDNEIIPELTGVYPPRILRSVDGTSFQAIGGTPGTMTRDDFGTQPINGFRSLVNYHGHLLATAYSGLLGDGVVVDVVDPTSASPQFVQVSPPNINAYELEVFNDHLYVGAGDAADGYSVWRADDIGPTATFSPIVQGGAGRGAAITSVVSMSVFQNRLYVGASGWGFLGAQSELIRINPDDTWELVVGNARSTEDGVLRSPISGLPDGFGNPFNAHFWRMQEHNGALYLGTNDWSWAFRAWPVIGDLLRPLFGFDLYGSCDGQQWWPVTTNGFDRGLYNFGVRTMASTPFGDFIGSANHAEGTHVWKSTDPSPCDPKHRGGKPRARTQSDGVALSWDSIPDAARYRVRRTEYRTVTVPVPEAPSLPTAAALDPALALSRRGGSTRPVSLTVPATTFEIGTTTENVFVDRLAKQGVHYTYEIVAEGSDGREIGRSGLTAIDTPQGAPR